MSLAEMFDKDNKAHVDDLSRLNTVYRVSCKKKEVKLRKMLEGKSVETRVKSKEIVTDIYAHMKMASLPLDILGLPLMPINGMRVTSHHRRFSMRIA